MRNLWKAFGQTTARDVRAVGARAVDRIPVARDPEGDGTALVDGTVERDLAVGRVVRSRQSGSGCLRFRRPLPVVSYVCVVVVAARELAVTVVAAPSVRCIPRRRGLGDLVDWLRRSGCPAAVRWDWDLVREIELVQRSELVLLSDLLRVERKFLLVSPQVLHVAAAIATRRPRVERRDAGAKNVTAQRRTTKRDT